MKAETKTRGPEAGRKLIRSASLIVALALAFVLPQAALADQNPANDSADITIHVTPVIDLGVIIDTTGSAWAGSSDLDTNMDLGATKRLDTGVKVTIAGTFNVQELQVQAAALDTWTLGATETDTPDVLRLYALFGKDAGTAPAASDFDGATNLVTTTPALAGQPQSDEGGDANHRYELPVAHAQYADVDNMRVGTVRRLWLRANTPSFSSTDTQQRFTVTVTAVSGAAQ